MFLHVVGHNQRFRVVHNTFRRSMETIFRYFKQVLYAVGELRGEMIRSPTGRTPTKIRTSPRWYPYFKNCIGAIDGSTHDANILSDSMSRHDGINIPDETFYLGDAGYACRPGVLPPFRKTRFKILDQKPFHPYPTQVKLVLACCIIHNWILQWGVDEFVSEEEDVTPDEVISSCHSVEAFDNEAWKNKRLEWAHAMWDNRDQTRI
ncbi:uncharacterized protein [Aegilops tauschii subsp. strangulata]|uniref:uncharacterized protein n=1 Tax=Aegilops tauschii subsp. strangulata TaxID=200361 RepID=UPI003CC8DD63